MLNIDSSERKLFLPSFFFLLSYRWNILSKLAKSCANRATESLSVHSVAIWEKFYYTFFFFSADSRTLIIRAFPLSSSWIFVLVESRCRGKNLRTTTPIVLALRFSDGEIPRNISRFLSSFLSSSVFFFSRSILRPNPRDQSRQPRNELHSLLSFPFQARQGQGTCNCDVLNISFT